MGNRLPLDLVGDFAQIVKIGNVFEHGVYLLVSWVGFVMVGGFGINPREPSRYDAPGAEAVSLPVDPFAADVVGLAAEDFAGVKVSGVGVSTDYSVAVHLGVAGNAVNRGLFHGSFSFFIYVITLISLAI